VKSSISKSGKKQVQFNKETKNANTTPEQRQVQQTLFLEEVRKITNKIAINKT